MQKRTLRKAVIVAGLALFCGGLVGCTGDTGGGSAASADLTGTEFVASDANTGTITLNVNETSLPVGSTSNFSVNVTDVNGAPVPQMQIACDSEVGVAIIEPATGFELTDSNGNMSGTIGCDLPGSFQFACRLPIGVNKRKFENIICTGGVPDGFTGFPGAGGGLGGGEGDVSVAPGDIEISSVAFLENGSEVDSIDTARGVCSGATDEPFYQGVVEMTVVNDSFDSFQINSLRFSINRADASGNPYAAEITVAGEREIAPIGGTGTVTAVIAQTSGTSKVFTGSVRAIPTTLGVRNVTVRLTGVTSAGETVTIAGRGSVAFTNVDNCS